MKILYLIPVLFLTACASLSLNDVYQQPTFDYQETKITAVLLASLSAQSQVKITNTNPYPLPLSQLSAKLQLEGEDWLDLDNDAISSLPAKGSATVAFNWSLIYDQLLTRMANVYEQGEANFTLLLEPTLEVPLLGPKSVIWRSEFSVPIPKLPTLSLIDWNVSSVSLTKIELTFNLGIANPNVFAINTQGWQAGFKQNKQSLASVELSDLKLPAEGSSSQEVSVSLSLANVGMSFVSALKNGQWPSQFALDWQGEWSSPDLAFKLPSLAGKLL
jgi:LEA14-like dessication related protein